jgi:hypothetical protein
MNDIKKRLDDLADMKAGLDVIRLQMQELIDSILTPEQKLQIAEIKDEFGEKTEAASLAVSKQESEIKEFVVLQGQSFKGERISAVYVNGRTSWDTESLDAIAATEEYAWISKFKKTGNPSVSIRIK